jgi:hypothetical protein
MIHAAIIGLSLVLPVATDPGSAWPPSVDTGQQLSNQQKNARMRPLISSATDCIARAVATDPRFEAQQKGGNVNDLIVESVSTCIEPVRVMIDSYDRLFGSGSGEEFFMGPYLDTLPTAVNRLVRGASAQ